MKGVVLLATSYHQFLHLEHFSGCLDQPDYSQSLQYFDSSATNGQLAYDMFAPVARELILQLYQVRDTSGVSVCVCVCGFVCGGGVCIRWSLLLSSAVRLGYIRGEVHAYFMLDAIPSILERLYSPSLPLG